MTDKTTTKHEILTQQSNDNKTTSARDTDATIE